MDYPKTDDEFSDWILERIEKIKEIKNISEYDRKKLYGLVNETVQRYQENKKLNLKENLVRLIKSWEGLYKSLENLKIIEQELKKSLPTLERIAKELTEKKRLEEIGWNNSNTIN